MPYIIPAKREPFDAAIKLLPELHSPPELTHVIFEACAWYIAHSTLNYQHVNDVMGVLACASLEFKRRVADDLHADSGCTSHARSSLSAQESTRFDPFIDAMEKLESVGELNYVISEVCAQYVLHATSRERQAERAGCVLEVLASVAREFYQDTAVSYENKKLVENGDTPGYTVLTLGMPAVG